MTTQKPNAFIALTICRIAIPVFCLFTISCTRSHVELNINSPAIEVISTRGDEPMVIFSTKNPGTVRYTKSGFFLLSTAPQDSEKLDSATKQINSEVIVYVHSHEVGNIDFPYGSTDGEMYFLLDPSIARSLANAILEAGFRVDLVEEI